MSRNTAKGTSFETLIVNSTNAFDPSLKLYRPAKAGARDVGDIHGASPFVIQAKHWTNLGAALPVAVDGAVQQAANAGEDYGVAVIKRPRKGGAGEAYAVMRYEDWVRVLLRLRRAEAQVRDSYQAALRDMSRPFPRPQDLQPFTIPVSSHS